MTIRVGVLGAGGRMGLAVCDAVLAEPDLDLVAACDSGRASSVLDDLGVSSDLVVSGDRQAVVDAQADVVVDFTDASARTDR